MKINNTFIAEYDLLSPHFALCITLVEVILYSRAFVALFIFLFIYFMIFSLVV